MPGEGYTPKEVLELVTIRYEMNLYSFQKYIATTVATNVSDKTVAVIMENADQLDGVSIEEDTIRKYNNPVSSIKIGSTTVKGSKFNKTDRLYLSYDKYVKQKNQLIITPKKGWEVNQIRTLNRSGSKEYQSLSIFDKNSIKPTGGKGNYKLSIEFRNTKINGGRITEEIVFK